MSRTRSGRSHRSRLRRSALQCAIDVLREPRTSCRAHPQKLDTCREGLTVVSRFRMKRDSLKSQRLIGTRQRQLDAHALASLEHGSSQPDAARAQVKAPCLFPLTVHGIPYRHIQSNSFVRSTFQSHAPRVSFATDCAVPLTNYRQQAVIREITPLETPPASRARTKQFENGRWCVSMGDRESGGHGVRNDKLLATKSRNRRDR